MSTILCKFCDGKGYSGPVHVNRGGGRGEWLDRIECTHCGETGVWDAEHLARYEEGQAHKKQRVERGESIRKAAARLGVTPDQLSSFETGRAALSEGPRS